MSTGAKPFARQVLISQLIVIALVLALVTAAFAIIGARAVTDRTEVRALTTARTLAASGVVRAASTDASRAGHIDPTLARRSAVQKYAMDVRRRAGVQFVVVTDNRGFRLTHPDESLLGKPVSTSPKQALAGHEEVTHERGTLGDTVRAKVPVYSTRGSSVVGEVSVGIHHDVVQARLHKEYELLAAIFALALGIGVLASVLLERRLRRATLGVGPEELADMARHQDAVLHGLDDGVLGFAPGANLVLANDRARALLCEQNGGSAVDGGPAWVDVAAGRRSDLPEVPAVIADIVDRLGSAKAGPLRRRIAVGERILLVTAVAVDRSGVRVGTVVTLRDETQVLTMTRQLESVTTMAGALRTQRHEFANRLHTALGLVSAGEHDEAEAYLRHILRTGPLTQGVPGLEQVGEPYLHAVLEAKGTTAAEAGVRLQVNPATLVLGRPRHAEDVTLILGNLIDNAVRAVIDHRAQEPVVDVTLLSDGRDLHALVADTGAGLSLGAEEIFAEGVTSSGTGRNDPIHGHGIGLALCRRVARNHGGDVWVVTAHDEALGGACFGVRLPGVLEPSPK